jgi:uncharacterized protein
MVRYFFDTSALVKRYHVEIGTPVVDAIFDASDVELYISRLAVVEVASALSLKVRTGEINASQLNVAHKRFHADVSQRRLMVTRILQGHFRNAERLLLAYATRQRLRTLDALQIAVALDLRKNQRIDQFVVADLLLADIATHEGLNSVNVLAPPTP